MIKKAKIYLGLWIIFNWEISLNIAVMTRKSSMGFSRSTK
jgi:hypothetical protein